MLFHVTLTHSQEDCPGRRPDETPQLIGPADRVEALGNELSVMAHSVVWGASCILWAEPEHVAYALLEAGSLEAVEQYIDALTPAGWETRALPVFTLPGQLAAVRQVLAAPAIPVVESQAPVTDSGDDRDTADTLEGLTRAIPQPVIEQPVVEQPVAPQPARAPDRPTVPDSSAVTRFVDSRTVLEGLGGSAPPTDSPSESSTVILEPKIQSVPGIRLVANTGPAQGSVFNVGEAGATLGRLPENTICLTDGRLSRHHARIDFRDDGYWLTDLGSQNGTLVNDHPLSEAHRLQAGDSIELGTTRMTVMLDADTN
jgi:predicted component of type VI protein secretion system